MPTLRAAHPPRSRCAGCARGPITKNTSERWAMWNDRDGARRRRTGSGRGVAGRSQRWHHRVPIRFRHLTRPGSTPHTSITSFKRAPWPGDAAVDATAVLLIFDVRGHRRGHHFVRSCLVDDALE